MSICIRSFGRLPVCEHRAAGAGALCGLDGGIHALPFLGSHHFANALLGVPILTPAINECLQIHRYILLTNAPEVNTLCSI